MARSVQSQSINWVIKMPKKPTYEELEQKVNELEKESVKRRSLEQALWESQEHLELALNGADLAMWNWNVETGSVEYGPRWAEMLGYSAEEIKPHVSSWEELIHPEDIPQVMQKVKANLEGLTSSYECEHRLKSKSGGWRWVLARGKVVERNNDGSPLRHTGTQFDVTDRVIAQKALKEARNALEQKVAARTAELVNANKLLKNEMKERKQIENSLRETETSYKELASFLPLSLFEADNQGNITFANPFAFETTGYNEEDIDKGLHMMQVIHPVDHNRAMKMSTQVMQGVHTDGSEYLMQRKDGSTFPAYINTTPSIKDNKAVGLTGYIFNLTEQKKAEEKLRESEERYRSFIENAPIAMYTLN